MAKSSVRPGRGNKTKPHRLRFVWMIRCSRLGPSGLGFCRSIAEAVQRLPTCDTAHFTTNKHHGVHNAASRGLGEHACSNQTPRPQKYLVPDWGVSVHKWLAGAPRRNSEHMQAPRWNSGQCAPSRLPHSPAHRRLMGSWGHEGERSGVGVDSKVCVDPIPCLGVANGGRNGISQA